MGILLGKLLRIALCIGVFTACSSDNSPDDSAGGGAGAHNGGAGAGESGADTNGSASANGGGEAGSDVGGGAGSAATNAGGDSHSGSTAAGAGGVAGSGGNAGAAGGIGTGGTSGSGGVLGEAGTSNAGVGGSAGSAGAVGAGGSAGAGGKACVPDQCPEGEPCPLGCHRGVCKSGTCTDSGAVLATGAPCGGGAVCDGAGQCISPSCTFIPANLYNCVPTAPCHLGHCFATGELCTQLPSNLDQAAPNGYSCGSNPNQVCQSGECVVNHCTAAGGSCSLACADPTGKALPDKTPCGLSNICSAGQCLPQLSLGARPFNFVPGTPFTVRLAQLTDLLNGDSSCDLIATIDWGDGQHDAGAITGSAGSFSIAGTHTFVQSGADQIRITASDPHTGASASVTFKVDQNTTEFPLTYAPWGITQGGDGNIWVGDDGGIDRVSPGGNIQHFNVGLGSVGELAAAADGSIWYTHSRHIGHISPTGFTEWPTNDPDQIPWDIAVGPDGNVWLTLDLSSSVLTTSIGRLNPATGAIQEFPVPAANTFLEGICAGPDGALWFTEYGAGKIGRITTAGVATDFTIPTANSLPVAIVTGPDGNLWFTEWATGQVGRITPSGTVTEFPTPLTHLQDIAPGPDGRVWFTANSASTVAAITKQGVVTQYPMLSTQYAENIALGSDHAVWYTERTMPQSSSAPGGFVARIATP